MHGVVGSKSIIGNLESLLSITCREELLLSGLSGEYLERSVENNVHDRGHDEWRLVDSLTEENYNLA